MTVEPLLISLKKLLENDERPRNAKHGIETKNTDLYLQYDPKLVEYV